jgi:hypothetical protein
MKVYSKWFLVPFLLVVMLFFFMGLADAHDEALWNDGGFYGNTYDGYKLCWGFLHLHRYAKGHDAEGTWQPVLWAYPVDKDNNKIGEVHPHTTEFTVPNSNCDEVFTIFQAKRSQLMGEEAANEK